MAVSSATTSDARPAPGAMLQGAAAALKRHVEFSGLGEEVSANVLRALNSDGRLLESEAPAALACLVLLAHESAGGARSDDAYPAVTAMECLLAAGDILDDMQDGDLEVKGWESPAVAAETMAALLVLAHGTLADGAVISSGGSGFARALQRLTTLEARALRGQARDVRISSHAVSHADAMAITRAKSGALGRCAAEMGACIATTDDHVITQHGDFGEHIAIVFQLMNDVAGIWPGQSSNSDLANQRPTPLLGYLSGRQDGLERTGDPSLSPSATMDGTREAVARSGAVQFAWALALAELTKARRKAHEIETLMPSSRLGDLLQG